MANPSKPKSGQVGTTGMPLRSLRARVRQLMAEEAKAAPKLHEYQGRLLQLMRLSRPWSDDVVANVKELVNHVDAHLVALQAVQKDCIELQSQEIRHYREQLCLSNEPNDAEPHDTDTPRP